MTANSVFNSDIEDLPRIVFMTPEYLFGSDGGTGCLAKVQKLEKEGKLGYIAVDEAHYIWQWGEFRKNYSQLKTLKDLSHNSNCCPYSYSCATSPQGA